MPLIILSSNSKEEEKEIAKKLLQVKGYGGVDPGILSEVEAKYHIDTGKLAETLEQTPSFFEKMMSGKWQYRLACIEAEVIERLMKDNTVCWGLAAHLYVVGISHALKVRIIHANQTRIENIVEQQGIPVQRAQKWLDTENQRRKKWSLAAFNRDETDPSEYDLVINLDQIDLNEAVLTINGAASYRKFQPITYSMKSLSDLALSAKVRTTLLKSMQDIRVQTIDGTVLVFTKAFKQKKIEKIKEIKDLAGKIEGVRGVEVHVTNNLFGDISGNANS
ncbi:MAG: cytidylate kinase-like family protein [Proteobacteria bacterium]|nr:cytidylate kinase-like family protein [Pseudomonadota bacterium]